MQVHASQDHADRDFAHRCHGLAHGLQRFFNECCEHHLADLAHYRSRLKVGWLQVLRKISKTICLQKTALKAVFLLLTLGIDRSTFYSGVCIQ